MVQSINGNRSSEGVSTGGSNYTVKSGDTLWAIAQRSGVSLNALIKANPQIKNPDLIFPGQSVNVPPAASGSLGGMRVSMGSSPSERPGGRMSANGGAGIDSFMGSGGGDGSAYNIAKGVMGNNISSLKYSGPLASYLAKWPPNNVCCANFVSACLEKAGQISHAQHNDSVRGLANNLSNDPQWKQVSLANAKPGDVVCFNVPGEGPMSHVVMFAGWSNGRPQFIGSNNVNADGSQRITQSGMNYPINSIFQYQG